MASKTQSLVVWWILSAWIINLSTVRCQNCSANTPFGPNATIARAEYQTVSGADDLFLIANGHSISCHGIITRWSFWSAPNLQTIPCYAFIAQIWRPSPLNSMQYLLVGENTLFDVDYCINYLNSIGASNTTIYLNIPPSSSIPVQPGDVLAWYDTSASVYRKIGFDSGLPGSSYMSTVYILSGISDCGNSFVGSGPCSWQTASVVGRNYGFEILVNPGRAPLILNLPSTISITELLPVGMFLFQVQANNSFTWNPTITPPLLYIITSASTTCNMSWFSIDPLNGSISVANLFNINAMILPFICKVNVEVQQNGAPPSLQKLLTINVANINEPHQIDNLPYTVSFDSATLTTGRSIYTVNYTDPDLLLFPTLPKSFYIVDISPPYFIFNIAASSGAISTTQPLSDWTGPDVFNISVTVSDGEFAAGPKILTVVLTNIIQPPVLLNLNATILLDETELLATTVYRVTSSIDATRTSSQIAYSILSQVPYSGIGPFTFGIISGVNIGNVTLDSSLDYVTVKQYAIEIKATLTYLGATLVSQPATLTVNVRFIDKAPTISITPALTIMSEDAAVGTAVPGITIIASDREYDNNLGDYLVFLVSDPHFVIDNVTRTMYTSGSLFILPPNLCVQTYPLLVYVRDSYGKISSSTLTVNVTRGNRESPTFSQAQYNGSVAENGVGGSPTGVLLTSTDPDCGMNQTTTYSILGDLANLYFQVDPVTGVITQKQPISQPTYPNMTFNVLASDGGRPSLNSTAVVFIVVNAINAHAPWFVDPYMELETRSDAPVGSSVYTLNVTDPDSASVNNISYQIVVVQNDFDVKSSGDIVPKRELSSYKRYSLYVMATDTGQQKNYFTDPATVVIDTYDAANQLIDIEMLRPLSETDPKLPEFIAKLNDFLKPWTVKMEDLKYKGDNTIVTIYAYDPVSTFSSAPTPKHFIDRDDLLAKLRTDIYGTPVDGLRGPEFADYEIVNVQPTYPVWVLDTVAGIATLTTVCFVALALIITTTVLLLRHFKMACFRKDKVAPSTEKTEPMKGDSNGEEFQLSYANTQPHDAKTADMTMFDIEPFERPPTYKANTPPLRPDADLEL